MVLSPIRVTSDLWPFTDWGMIWNGKSVIRITRTNHMVTGTIVYDPHSARLPSIISKTKGSSIQKTYELVVLVHGKNRKRWNIVAIICVRCAGRLDRIDWGHNMSGWLSGCRFARSLLISTAAWFPTWRKPFQLVAGSLCVPCMVAVSHRCWNLCCLLCRFVLAARAVASRTGIWDPATVCCFSSWMIMP